jgi:acyl-CoA thioester hydrolase
MIPVSANRSTRIQVRFGDYDPNGHVNNVAYVAFMETARIAFLVSLREVGRMATTIIAHAEVDYLRPITTRAKYVEVEMSVEKIGTSSFTLLHEIFDNHGLAARGRAVLVGIDPQGKSRSLTEHEQRTLAQHVQPEGQSVAVGQPA